MENASKALIMAAGVLIGILVLSLGVYLFAVFGDSSAKIQSRNEQKIVSEFNSQFTAYEGRTDLKIYDIITIVNYAKENNNIYELDKRNRNDDNTFYISVKLGSSYIEDWSIEEQNEQLEKLSQLKYKCLKTNISKKTGRVYQIIFIED